MTARHGLRSGTSTIGAGPGRALVRIAGIFLLVLLMSSAGCIKYLNTEKESAHPSLSTDPAASASAPAPAPLSSGNSTGNQSTGRNDTIATAVPTRNVDVSDVDPVAYITPDPYRLPYRDHGNWSTYDENRLPRIPEFSRTFVLVSNASAVRVNVTTAPLMIDLTFSPFFNSPDQTGDTSSSYPTREEKLAAQGGPPVTKAPDEDWSSSRNLSGSYAFVYPDAEITVIDALTNETVAKDGYNLQYSSDTHKRIAIYRNGSFIVTLKGDFMQTTMTVTTGSAMVIRPTLPAGTTPADSWQ